jgi:hypothetical protein
VTFAGFVHAGEYRVHNAEPCFTRDASPRNAGSGAHASVSLTGRLDRADDGRSDGNDAPTLRLRLSDCRRSSLRNAIGLIERKAQVERTISGRGDTGSVRQCGESDAPLTPRCKCAPVERKSG